MISPTASPTERIVAAAIETKATDLPEPVIDATKRVVLDTVACTVGAFATEPGRVVARLKQEQSGAPQATLTVTGERLPVASVAYVHAQVLRPAGAHRLVDVGRVLDHALSAHDLAHALVAPR